MTKKLKEFTEHLARTMLVLLLLSLSNMGMAQTGTTMYIHLSYAMQRYCSAMWRPSTSRSLQP